jgi:hypothetical protein
MKGKIHIRVEFDDMWIRGALYGGRGGAWGTFRNNIHRELRRRGAELGSPYRLCFRVSATYLRPRIFRVMTWGDYGKKTADVTPVITKVKSIVAHELACLQRGYLPHPADGEDAKAADVLRRGR